MIPLRIIIMYWNQTSIVDILISDMINIKYSINNTIL